MGLRLASWSSIQNASGSRLLHDSRDNYLDFHRPKDGLQMDRSVLGGLRAHRPLAAPAQQPSSHFLGAQGAASRALARPPRHRVALDQYVRSRLQTPWARSSASAETAHASLVQPAERRDPSQCSVVHRLQGRLSKASSALCGRSSRRLGSPMPSALTMALPSPPRPLQVSLSSPPGGSNSVSVTSASSPASHSRMAAMSGCISPSNSPPPVLLPAPGKPSSVPSTAFASSTMSSALTKRSTNASLPTSTAARSDFDYPEDYERSRVRNRPPRLERSLRLCLCRSEAAMARPSVANERPWRVYFCQLPIGTLSGNRFTPL